MRTLTTRLRKYAAAVNHHLGDYRERLSRQDLGRIGYLLLPPLPKQFRYRFVPEAEQRAATQRKRKAKTDVISECATAVLALMLARYPSMDRFIGWYRKQIARIEAGELSVPARLVYQDEQLDLPRQPGPDAVSVEELRWRTSSVRLELSIWRPHEFSQRRCDERIQRTTPGTQEHEQALDARMRLRYGRTGGSTLTRMPTSSRCTPPTRCPGLWGRWLAGTPGLANRCGAALRRTEASAHPTPELALPRFGWAHTWAH